MQVQGFCRHARPMDDALMSFNNGYGGWSGNTRRVIHMAEEAKKPEDKSLVVKSAVGDYLRTKDVKVSSDLYDVLNGVLKELLDKAVKRATGNGRKTVMVQDL